MYVCKDYTSLSKHSVMFSKTTRESRTDLAADI